MLGVLKQPARSRRWGQAGPWRTWKGVVVASLAAVVVAAPAHAADLHWKFQPGETLKYTLEQKMSTSSKIPEQGELKTSMSQIVTMHWDVESVGDDGVAQMSQTIDRVQTKIESPILPFEFDSSVHKEPDNSPTAALVPLLKSLVGSKFTFKMAPNGELSDVKVPEKVLKAVQEAGAIAAAGGGLFNEKGLKEMISQSSLVFPDGAIEPGKTWSRQTKMPIPNLGAIVQDRTFTFRGPEADHPGIVDIDLENKVSFETEADAKYELQVKSQSSKGLYKFDSEKGRIVSSAINDKMEMSINAGAMIDQATESAISLTLNNGEPAKTDDSKSPK
jgi:hypothetical protein